MRRRASLGVQSHAPGTAGPAWVTGWTAQRRGPRTVRPPAERRWALAAPRASRAGRARHCRSTTQRRAVPRMPLPAAAAVASVRRRTAAGRDALLRRCATAAGQASERPPEWTKRSRVRAPEPLGGSAPRRQPRAWLGSASPDAHPPHPFCVRRGRVRGAGWGEGGEERKGVRSVTGCW